ncbi:hypothetical protein IU510_21100 [Nocardia cyriacigeorgica]|uniref:hypothetical protein n=1 Tax=Nocardia TaxID=1817 RepID=UPI0018942F2C|nr:MULTISPECIES: hypothetical protein [Nocardia]MBF6100559.1 hypothetical protein [Nocardia cyriacigeorgica]
MTDNQNRQSTLDRALTRPEIMALVAAHTARLRRMTRVLDLERFAATHGLCDQQAFGMFAHALRHLAGVDIDAIRALNLAQKRADPVLVEQASRGPCLALWCSGTRTHFTVARAGGHIIWRDRHPHVGPVRPARAAKSAAQQAIRVAGRARVEWGAEAATLRLTMDRTHGVDLLGLHHRALAANLLLELVVDPARTPAAYADGDSTLSWHGSDPATLIAVDQGLS